MGIILSIKIDNQVITDQNVSVSPLKISNSRPTINWEFDVVERSLVDEGTGEVSSEGEFGQYSYEIRVGTSDTNISTDAFIGNMTQTGVIDSQNRFWMYNGSALVRGETYYGQVRVVDESNRTSDWATFAFYYNSLPSVANVAITPSSPSVNDDLVLSYDFNDGDGDEESGSIIRWYKNGEYQKQYDNSITIDRKFLQNGDAWMAEVHPSDGYEYGIKVSSRQVVIRRTSVTVSDVKVLPDNPNENDILKADYLASIETEQENVSIRWYINNILQRDYNDKQFIKPDLVEGDIVRCEVKHTDSVSYVSSPDATIEASDFVVRDITVDGGTEPLDVSSARPTVQWRAYVPTGKVVNYISVKIGTFYEDDSVYSTVVPSNKELFSIPGGILQKGRDYYISIAISDTTTFVKYTSSHFRIRGSRWEEGVKNSTGWTIETLLFATDSTTESDDYQVIRINDGTRFAEIKLKSTSISLISGSVMEYTTDLTKTSVITIAGKRKDIKVYLNRSLIIDGVGVFTQASTAKTLEFGCPTGGEFGIKYKYFFYTVSGYYLPSESSEYTDIKFHNFMQFENNEIADLRGYISGQILFGLNPDNEIDNSSIYAMGVGESSIRRTTTRTFAPINNINISPDKKKIVCSHANGVTIIDGYIISPFGSELIFVDENGDLNEVLPSDSGWDLIQNSGYDAVYFNSNGLHINTLEQI